MWAHVMHRQNTIMLTSDEKKNIAPCFYKLAYYELVSQEYRHRSELKKKAKFQNFFSPKFPEGTGNKRRK